MRGLVALSLLSLTACTDGLEDNIPTDTAFIYVDADRDGVPADFDCDDNNPLRYPNKAEICDGVDNDCDEEIDEDAADANIWYVDRDGDFYGNPDEFEISCDEEAPLNRVSNGLDCNDDEATVNPGASEICDGLDNDCDERVDENLGSEVPTWYFDGDGDGYGNSTTEVTQCEAPAGYVDNKDDCNDSNPDISPDATEDCLTTFDDDCSGTPNDLDADNCTNFYIDNDNDGFGLIGMSRCQCSPGSSMFGNFSTDQPGDCNDGDTFTYPGADELCGDGLDQDCSGNDTACDVLPAEDADAFLVGDKSSDALGYALAGGDVNGDGLQDLLVSAPVPTTTNSRPGEVYVFFGPLSAGEISPGDANATLQGEFIGDWAGASIAVVGDTNGDNVPDVLVGAPREDTSDTNAGAAYLLTGPTVGAFSLENAHAKLLGEDEEHLAGSTVAAAGDMNLDGRADFWVGAPGYTGLHPQMGAVYLMQGPVAGEVSLSDATAKLEGEDYLDEAGYAISGGQDIDGDGLDDLLVGAPYEDSFRTDAGAAYVVLAPVLGDASLGDADAKITGEARFDQAGSAVAILGDINGDGAADYAVGACKHDGSSEDVGAVYLFTDGIVTSGSVTDAQGKLTGEVGYSEAGCAISAAGDVNGDGFDDFLVSATGDGAAQFGAGATFLIPGPVTGTQSLAEVALLKIVGESASDRTGTALAGIGDVNDDGLDDVAIGSPESDDGSTGAGKAYLLFGF